MIQTEISNRLCAPTKFKAKNQTKLHRMAEHFEHISLRHRRRRRRRASVCMFIIAGEVFRLFQIYDTKSWNPNRPYIVYCARRMGMNRTEPTERRKREKTNWKHTRTKRIENSVVNALFGAIDGRSGNAHALFSGTKPCAYPHSTHTRTWGLLCWAPSQATICKRWQALCVRAL